MVGGHSLPLRTFEQINFKDNDYIIPKEPLRRFAPLLREWDAIRRVWAAGLFVFDFYFFYFSKKICF